MHGCENYPTALPRSLQWVDDVYDLGEQLEQKSEFLFVTELSKIKLEVSIQGAGISTK